MRNCVVLLALVLMSCHHAGKNSVFVKNTLPFPRKAVVSIPAAHVDSVLQSDPDLWQIVDATDGTLVRSQRVDSDGDGRPDELLFLAVIAAHEERAFELTTSSAPVPDTSSSRCYGRFVPERIDDYAWENDLVAFRTYGPEAQRLVDAGEKGGTLSSGVDCWLKRVPYPIIDKWYNKASQGGTYHHDDGEGYDPYHVGNSRGCGGTGIWIDDSLYVSKNFVSYRKIADGPIRAIFELTYAPWRAGGITVTEQKRISIDLGSQLCRVEDLITSAEPVPNLTIGIAMHDHKGTVQADAVRGWFSYWEPMDDSQLGTGVVIDPVYLIRYEDYRTEKKDLSQIHILTKPIRNRVVYYTGFGWAKAGTITSPVLWKAYLDQFSQGVAAPIQVSFN